ncbi:MAG: hypothetical protein A2Y20_09935 [Firmicutes bacterium GWF2_51_9]|nr:MAG: hypothetical protein A2Y20_09935 [Firmicutes bacterium GWF2_51_9]OGS59333.1 MAG: hypothetical protein A2Y19_09050 [Firmicutes bacterium GWE2_51_13]HAM62383.1 hypothetical protein [Erysipelotrichaceae bacterium]HBZ40290.1 hypothetical protein [Erysipelotrichaceae bacterium]
MKKSIYIKAVMVVFGLLILSRIPDLLNNGMNPVTLVSSIVELCFIVWGILVLRNENDKQ